MKHILTMAIAFFMAIGMSYGQVLKPKDLVAQQKALGKSFQSTNVFSAVKSAKSVSKLPKELKNFTILSLDQSKNSSIKSSSPEQITLDIPGQKSTMTLDLVKVDIATDDFQIVEMPSGKVVKSNNDIVHYRGIITGKPGSVAAVSFYGDEVSALISSDETGNLVLGKIENDDNHVLYKDADISKFNDFVCQSDMTGAQDYSEDQLEDSEINRAGVKCPEVFFDIASDIVSDKGGTQAASNFIQAIFNQVAIMYANESLTVKISGFNVWTSNTPFSDLGAYRNYRNQNAFNGDLGHYVTYNYSGGVAYLNGLCNSYKYGISGIRSSFQNVPTYSWSVMVITHELGHNFGSNHTQACRWNGNNTAIDGCVSTEGGCARPGIPQDGGTVMSYCHLTSVGINLNKGFGPQPGNVIRNTINNSSCTDSCTDGGGCSTGDEVTVTFINNTDCEVQYFWNNNGTLVAYDEVASGGSVTYNSFVGNDWIVRDDSNDTIDEFTITCENTNYTTTGDCGDTGGDICAGVSPWSSNVSYSVGDKVTYQGYLFERTSTGWRQLGRCGSSDICAGVSPWSSSVRYSVGDRVTYNNTLYERTSTGWRNLGACAGGLVAAFEPGDGGKDKTIMYGVFPNPAKDFVRIQGENMSQEIFKVQLVDISGKILRSIDTEPTPDGLFDQTISLDNVSAGIYFIQVNSIEGKDIQKIFVQ